MTEDEFMVILEDHWKNSDAYQHLSPESRAERARNGSTLTVARALLNQFDHADLRAKFTAWKKGSTSNVDSQFAFKKLLERMTTVGKGAKQ